MQHLFIKTTQKLRKSVKNCQLQSNTATFFYGPQCLKYNDTVTKVVYENKPDSLAILCALQMYFRLD